MKWKIELFKEATITVELLHDGTISIETQPEILKKIISYRETKGRIILSMFRGDFAILSKKTGKQTVKSNFTAVELRNNFEILNSLTEEELDIYINNLILLRNSTEENPVKKEYKNTDLHTHFLEILTGREFLDIMRKYTDEVYVRDIYSYELVGRLFRGDMKIEEFPTISLEEAEKEGMYDSICDQLSISLNGKTDFDTLLNISIKRGQIMELAIKNELKKQELEDNRENRSKIRIQIYIDIMKKVIEIYKREKIRYAEMSFSSKESIIGIVDYLRSREKNEQKQVKIEYLYSFSRNVHKGKETDKRLSDFKELIDKDYVMGFDLMGEEAGMTLEDTILKDNRDEMNKKSFAYIVSGALDILKGHEDKVLRLHAGENFASRYNPLYSLRVIKEYKDRELKKDNNYKLPKIRLGHGLYMPENKKELEEYARLLKELNVTIELNATSNYTLSNTNDLYMIPYEWYVEHGIPVVLGTDGEGMYLTDPKQERLISRNPDKEPEEQENIIEEKPNPDQQQKKKRKSKKEKTTIEKIEEIRKACLALDIHRLPNKKQILELLNKLLKMRKNMDRDDISFKLLVDEAIYGIKNEIYYNTRVGISFEDFDEYIDAIAEHITKRKDKKKKYQEYYTIDLIEEDIKQINYDVQVLEHYLFDVTSNEHIYNSFEIQVFTSTLDKIKELVDNNKIDGAKYKLVALQMYFGLNVHFVDTMQKIIFKNIELEDILFGNFLRNNNLDSPRRRH